MRSDSPIRGAVFTLDPRTEELLREVAADPSSCLLRVPRREVEEALTRTDYRGLSSTVGLSLAERELLRTARAELAYWLNVVCFRRLTEDEETRTFTSGVGESDQLLVLPTRAEQSQALRDLRDDFRSVPIDEDEDVARCAECVERDADGRDRRAPVRDIAALGLVLAPSFTARLYTIQSMSESGPVGLAMQAARTLTALCAGRVEKAYALGALGTVEWHRGDVRAALAAYSSAAALMPTLPEFALRAIIMAIHARDLSVVEAFIRRPEIPGSIRNSISAVTRYIPASSPLLDPATTRFLCEVRGHASPQTMELFDAIMCR